MLILAKAESTLLPHLPLAFLVNTQCLLHSQLSCEHTGMHNPR